MKVKVTAKESVSLNYGKPIVLSKGKTAVLDVPQEVLADLKKVPGLRVVSVGGRVKKKVVALKEGVIDTGLLQITLKKGAIAELELTEEAYQKLLSDKVIADYVPRKTPEDPEKPQGEGKSKAPENKKVKTQENKK